MQGLSRTVVVLPVAAVLVAAGLAAQDPAPPAGPSSPSGGTAASESNRGPWRLDDALGTPDWLKLSGEYRLRWEGLDGEYRAGTLAESDHLLLSRALLKAEFTADPFGATVELIDARQFWASTDSYLTNSIVDPIDFLQLFGEVRLGDANSGANRLRVGRQTIDLGSRRLVARNRFRNTINSFDGIDWHWQPGEDEDTWVEAFWTMPVLREPTNGELSDLRHNRPELDKHDEDYQFWGAFFTTGVAEKTAIEAYFYGLTESGARTRHRNIYTPGIRIVRDKQKGAVDFQWETAIQFGESRLSRSATMDLDHLAWLTHVSAGYSFDAAWSPHLRIAWDYASGDEDPTDGDNGRFETLFGARRFEFGPTSEMGAIARANLNSPEVRLSLKPSTDTEAHIAWRGVWLAEKRDQWTSAGVQDPTGAAGSHVGDQIEARVRWNIVPKSLQLDVGAAVLIAGDFQKDAPNGQGRDTYFGYAAMSWTF
ncbi:MAG: alginate export family protein [Planctomycetes bacterium]|nr:alginate export family protein [Planctomycetota bacterium]